jgi:hypothetical protein
VLATTRSVELGIKKSVSFTNTSPELQHPEPFAPQLALWLNTAPNKDKGEASSDKMKSAAKVFYLAVFALLGTSHALEPKAASRSQTAGPDVCAVRFISLLSGMHL